MHSFRGATMIRLHDLMLKIHLIITKLFTAAEQLKHLSGTCFLKNNNFLQTLADGAN